jgi:hypothetical protein
MITPVVPVYHKRKRRPRVPPPPPPAGPVLVSAGYDEAADVILTFDRPVTIEGFAASSITLVDGPNGVVYNGGGGAVQEDDVTIRVDLTSTGTAEGAEVRLTALSNTGFVAVGGAMWDGVTDLELPYP